MPRRALKAVRFVCHEHLFAFNCLGGARFDSRVKPNVCINSDNVKNMIERIRVNKRTKRNDPKGITAMNEIVCLFLKENGKRNK